MRQDERTGIRGLTARLRDSFFVRPHEVFAFDSALSRLALDPARVRRLADVQSLSRLGRREIRDIDPTELCDPAAAAQLARTALESGCRLWVLSEASAPDLLRLRELFGGALEIVSAPDGTNGLAYALTPGEAALRLLLAHPEHAPVFDGIDAADVPAALLALLRDLEVGARHRPAVVRLMRDPRFYVYLTVFVYSALRALPVTFVKEFEGSLLVLWSIDLVTAVPYTWGVLAMLTGRTRPIRILGALVTLVTFIAPYVYFWMHGKDYPPVVIVVIVLLVLITLVSELWKLRDERLLQRRYATPSAERAASIP